MTRKQTLKKNVTKKGSLAKKRQVHEHAVSSEVIFNNREIGWLNFNLRVLNEADDLVNPLLERLRFLSISSSNLDEFFMKRVGGLQRYIAYGLSPKSSDGQTPKKQLVLIGHKVQSMVKKQKEIFVKLATELQKQNVYITTIDQISTEEKKYLKSYFLKQIFPILIPLSVDPGHPFPFISNLSTSLAVSLSLPESLDEKIFARIKIPKLIDQWVPIAETGNYIHLNQVVQAFVSELFPGMIVNGSMIFKVTRNADSDQEEEDTEDLLAKIEEELRQRRFAEVVRLEFGDCTDQWLKDFLKKQLEVKENDVYPLPMNMDFTDLNSLVTTVSNALGYNPDLFFTPWQAPNHFDLNTKESIFSTLDKQDILLHHPYENFSTSVERFVSEAADDPQVLAIKMTLYRTGDNSPFIQSLIRAAENKKQVVCLIELKARFDEERNIYWAQELENAGVHVVYGIVGLKTHAKTTLITRRQLTGEVKTYAHIGTGNYNVSTAKFYTDVGLLTSHENLTSELTLFFNSLTGKTGKVVYNHLLVAPINMFQKFKDLILREVRHAEKGLPTGIMAKFNNMEENDISLSLYAASQFGVQSQLIVRGFCCLKTGIKGFSENIHVQSTLGRFLEHSRIFYFRNGKKDPVDGDFFIGSADWMYRNLHARVEAICPVYDRQAKEKLWDILQTYWSDQAQSWVMASDGQYKRKGKRSSYTDGVQQQFMNLAQNSLIQE